MRLVVLCCTVAKPIVIYLFDNDMLTLTMSPKQVGVELYSVYSISSTNILSVTFLDNYVTDIYETSQEQYLVGVDVSLAIYILNMHMVIFHF